MPNWCNNNMTIRHNDPAMIQKAADAWNSGNFLQTLIPTPDELLNTVKGHLGDGEEQKELELKVAQNIEKYGYGTWWDYRVEEWGTKWDIGLEKEYGDPVTVENNEFFVFFDSAWSPPCAAYEKLEAMGFEIKAYYYEMGCDFCGKWEAGQDNCYLVSKGNIPDDIMEEMGIETESEACDD